MSQQKAINLGTLISEIEIEMSVEAFAMAGVDYMECALEHPSSQAKLETNYNPRLSHVNTSLSLDNGMAMEWVKMKMREWATAVALNNETKANLRVSEILLIMDHNHLMRGKADIFS